MFFRFSDLGFVHATVRPANCQFHVINNSVEDLLWGKCVWPIRKGNAKIAAIYHENEQGKKPPPLHRLWQTDKRKCFGTGIRVT